MQSYELRPKYVIPDAGGFIYATDTLRRWGHDRGPAERVNRLYGVVTSAVRLPGGDWLTRGSRHSIWHEDRPGHFVKVISSGHYTLVNPGLGLDPRGRSYAPSHYDLVRLDYQRGRAEPRGRPIRTLICLGEESRSAAVPHGGLILLGSCSDRFARDDQPAVAHFQAYDHDGKLVHAIDQTDGDCNNLGFHVTGPGLGVHFAKYVYERQPDGHDRYRSRSGGRFYVYDGQGVRPVGTKPAYGDAHVLDVRGSTLAYAVRQHVIVNRPKTNLVVGKTYVRNLRLGDDGLTVWFWDRDRLWAFDLDES